MPSIEIYNSLLDSVLRSITIWHKGRSYANFEHLHTKNEHIGPLSPIR